MLSTNTVMKMENMKLHGMAKCFQDIIAKPEHSQLSHEEFTGFLIDAEETARDSRRLKRLLQYAHFKQQACLEDIDYKIPRQGLHKKIILELGTCKWIHNYQNILISGSTGIGKTFIACALGNCAARNGYSVLYTRAPRMFTTLFQTRSDNSYLKHLSKLSKVNILIIDDLGMSPLSETERKDLLEIVEDRSLSTSTIITSQVPIKDWYQIIGDPTIADAICDRLIHNAFKIELDGDSVRKTKNSNKSG